ncbi:hypothetical protein ACO0M4_05825 [Streptomyces sp. RGM 3693]|uniref:hypothetical protein n=1 Tax=Streptomyces sp. RGM 3693 TaxID=3413284 RepID=UPI003D2D3E53
MTTLTVWPVPLVSPKSARPARRRSDDAPIFDALAERWAAAGRLVPGTDDHEWTMLVEQAPWPSR